MRVAVIGTGHVGLTTCVTLASLGHTVIGFDADARKVAQLRSGRSPFFEPGMDHLLAQGVAEQKLCFVEEPAPAIAGADIVFICVGTPARADGEANLIAVEAAAREVARQATGPAVVAEKSTVPAGTALRVKRTLLQERHRSDLAVVSNPEFLREGSAIGDALAPDRILVGADSPWAFGRMRALYEPILAQGCRLIETDLQTAELSKHACNAFLALKVSYVNALARICERTEADIEAVTEVMGTDARIAADFLRAGLGYGGYCFPKDLLAFERLASRLGYEFPLLREIARINDEAVDAVAQKVEDALWNLEGKKIALLGLSFKPGTDDVRFAPALALARRLLSEKARVSAYDPRAMENARVEVPEIEGAAGPYEAATDADCLVVCTEWPEFRKLDLPRLRSLMAYPIVVDGRNLFAPGEMAAAGFIYHATGRPLMDRRKLAPPPREQRRHAIRKAVGLGSPSPAPTPPRPSPRG